MPATATRSKPKPTVSLGEALDAAKEHAEASKKTALTYYRGIVQRSAEGKPLETDGADLVQIAEELEISRNDFEQDRLAMQRFQRLESLIASGDSLAESKRVARQELVDLQTRHANELATAKTKFAAAERDLSDALDAGASLKRRHITNPRLFDKQEDVPTFSVKAEPIQLSELFPPGQSVSVGDVMEWLGVTPEVVRKSLVKFRNASERVDCGDVVRWVRREKIECVFSDNARVVVNHRRRAADNALLR